MHACMQLYTLCRQTATACDGGGGAGNKMGQKNTIALKVQEIHIKSNEVNGYHSVPSFSC